MCSMLGLVTGKFSADHVTDYQLSEVSRWGYSILGVACDRALLSY